MKINITINEAGRPEIKLPNGEHLEGVYRAVIELLPDQVTAQLQFWLPPHEFKGIEARITREHLVELAGNLGFALVALPKVAP